MAYSSFSLLVADIGATKTTMALYDSDTWPNTPLLQETYQNKQAKSFDQLIDIFIAKADQKPIYASIGIAGIVLEDHPVHMTNLDWTISGQVLKKRFNFQNVFLMNDLVATAMGAVILPPKDCLPLSTGTPISGAPVSILAPGTGLGEAFVIRENNSVIPLPSEGAHVSFAPRTALQIELLEYMMKSYDHVSVEHVCSGTGMPDLFSFMSTKTKCSPQLQYEVENTTDKTPVIVKYALESFAAGNHNCTAYQTLQIFCEILADEAANLALKTMSFGGIFLGGGLSLRIQPFLETNTFMSIFTRGVYKKWLSDIPIHIIQNRDTAIIGAAAYGFNKIKTFI